MKYDPDMPRFNADESQMTFRGKRYRAEPSRHPIMNCTGCAFNRGRGESCDLMDTQDSRCDSETYPSKRGADAIWIEIVPVPDLLKPGARRIEL